MNGQRNSCVLRQMRGAAASDPAARVNGKDLTDLLTQDPSANETAFRGTWNPVRQTGLTLPPHFGAAAFLLYACFDEKRIFGSRLENLF